MTKVEELREMVLESIARYGNERYHDGSRVGESWLDALIAAAKEEERERIREGSQMVGVEKYGVNFIGGVDYVGSAFLVPIDVMDPPTSPLAPAKEEPTKEEKIAHLAEIVRPVEEQEATIITRAGTAPEEKS